VARALVNNPIAIHQAYAIIYFMSFLSLETDSKPLKILFVASEAGPYAQVGGLGEVMRSLPTALRELGYDARVFIPKYALIDTVKYPLEMELANLKMSDSEKDPYGLMVCNVLSAKDKDGNIVAYFLENMEYYEKRANIYGYNDDTTRWLLLAKGSLEFIRHSDWKPDVIVCCDWQSGLVADLQHKNYKDDPILSKIASVFSIHNLKHQGAFDPRSVSEIDYDSGQGEIPDFFDPNIWKLNGTRRGILYADVINTVSPTYAKEILLPDNGETLDNVLKERSNRLFGILNGIDYDYFDPETDKQLAANYSAENFKKRISNKTALQKRVGLPEDKEKFIISFVGRLDNQKGLDLLREISDSLFENLDFQMVITGNGDNDLKYYFQDLQKKYPTKIGLHLIHDTELRKLIYAGSDVVMVPSLFEPCGLVQMEAMRYGCIPVVRKVGGLADTVIDYNPDKDVGTGFVFEKYDRFAFLISIVRSYEAFRNKKEWNGIIKRAMSADFSWRNSAKEYLELFQNAIKFHSEQS